MKINSLDDLRVGVVGLGYVGLPLAVEIGRQQSVIGFDISSERIDQLKQGIDATGELTMQEIVAAKHLQFTKDARRLQECNFYIITVPTPVDKEKQPDLTPLIIASETVGIYLKNGDVVVYESTVYPGLTEEICVPILSNLSGLIFNENYYVGYSPERINPGDKSKTIRNIVKITSGSTQESAELIDKFYASFITAGTHKASCIRVAEAAKVIENTQRDVNIALMNELAILFNMMDLDTSEVLAAAETKWNFLPFRPGLVGGHCIGVDPYYLTHKAMEVGYSPEMILSGRKLNDFMPKYVVRRLLSEFDKRNIGDEAAKILVLGATFKENCADLRNSKVIEILDLLSAKNFETVVCEPNLGVGDINLPFKTKFSQNIKDLTDKFDAIIIAVPHDQFLKLEANEIVNLGREKCVIFDVKSAFPDITDSLRL